MGLLDLPPAVKVAVTVTLHENGALSVEGPVHDKAFCVAMLENAIDAVRGHGRAGLVVPSHDVQVPAQRPYVPMEVERRVAKLS